jgi:fibronectin-binding autotransporter adhesin
MNTSALLRVLAVCLLLLGWSSPPAQAQPVNSYARTFTVNTTSTTGDSNLADCICNDGTGHCSLTAAVEEANYCTGDDEILLANSTTYTLPATYVINPASNSATEEIWIHTANDANPKATLSGPASSLAFDIGKGQLYLTNLNIQNSKGISVNSDNVLGLSYVTMRNNSGADGTPGDDWYGGGAINNYYGAVTITFSTFENNQTAGNGGAILNVEGDVVISYSTFLNNTAQKGGAIANYSYYAPEYGLNSHLNIASSEFTGNSAVQTGGGLYLCGSNYQNQQVILNTTVVNGNDAGTKGGGVYLGPCNKDMFGGGMTMLSSTVSNNLADYGAGIAVENTGNLYARYEVYLENTTLSGNQALIHGGGLYMPDNSTVAISSSTITDNSADREGSHAGNGGGIYNYSQFNDIRLENTLIAGNHDLSSGTFAPVTFDCDGDVDLQGYNLIGILQPGVCDLNGDMSGTLSGSMTTPLDPLLGPLASGGYYTPSHPLLTGSPAIDRGDPTGCKNPDGTLISSDERGESRHRGWSCDIGAYESNFVGVRVFLPAILR